MRCTPRHKGSLEKDWSGFCAVQCAGEVGVAAVVEWQGTREAGVSSTLILI